ncbi:hypothetical protein BJ912DRAFT_235077 [Pholiota molesta]|nr:hypothetical protein BJ912DRAFT_235077 [Pholiota molesta]
MESQIPGPITRVPHDILTEIFVHCLPEHRLKHRQPDTTIAPMLLCHICSTWRAVALTTAALWSHLSCRLTVAAERNRFEDGNWVVRKNQYAFLLWWKTNQRSMVPSLCLDLNWNHRRHSETVLDSELELDQVGMISLFDYISSSQYIETDELYWVFIGNRIRCGYPIVYPVPHTLVQSHWLEYEHFDYFYQDQVTLVPNHSPSALRHLYLNGKIHLHTFDIPNHWSSLTHIALLVSEMSLAYWYSLTRAVPQLQLGRFRIEVLDDDDYDEPTPCTLGELSTLFITVDQMNDNSELEYPFGMLFAALHLPALRDLSLSSGEAWYDHRALDHIYPVLASAPAITTLTLGPSLLSLQNDEDYRMHTLPLIKDAEPIWRRAPHLVHLRLVGMGTFGRFQRHAEERRHALVRNLFHRDSRWLDLNDAACPIRGVTIVDRQPLPPQANHIADYTRSRIREYAGRSPDVKAVLDVVFETQDQAIAGAWNEWGPNLS